MQKPFNIEIVHCQKHDNDYRTGRIDKSGGGVLLEIAKLLVSFKELFACAPDIIWACFFTLQ